MNHTPILWFSRKPHAVAMSTADAEYRAIEMASQHGKMLKRLLQSLPMMPTDVHTDALTYNQPTLNMLFSLAGTKLTKFIYLRHNFIKEEVRRHNIHYRHVPSELMKADVFKKELTKRKFNCNRNALCVQGIDNTANEGACGT